MRFYGGRALSRIRIQERFKVVLIKCSPRLVKSIGRLLIMKLSRMDGQKKLSEPDSETWKNAELNQEIRPNRGPSGPSGASQDEDAQIFEACQKKFCALKRG